MWQAIIEPAERQCLETPMELEVVRCVAQTPVSAANTVIAPLPPPRPPAPPHRCQRWPQVPLLAAKALAIAAHTSRRPYTLTYFPPLYARCDTRCCCAAEGVGGGGGCKTLSFPLPPRKKSKLLESRRSFSRISRIPPAVTPRVLRRNDGGIPHQIPIAGPLQPAIRRWTVSFKAWGVASDPSPWCCHRF